MVKYLPHFPLYLPPQGSFPGADGNSVNESRYWLNREICNSFDPILAGSDTQMAMLGSRPSTHLGRGAIAMTAH